MRSAPPMPRENEYAFSRRDRLKQLRAFCYAARLLSISRAAERLFLSQPALSYQIRALEEELAVTLFDRHGAGIVLTPVGERLYRASEPLVEQLDRLPATFAEGFRGVVSSDLNVAASQTTAVAVLPKIFTRLKKHFPQVRVNVHIGDGRQRLRWLMDYEVDLALVAVDVIPPDVKFFPLLSSEMVFITPVDHPLAGRTSVELAEFNSYPAVAQPSSTYVSAVAEMFLRQYGNVLAPVVEVGGWLVIKQYVEAGVGVSVVPDFCLTEHDCLWSIPASQYFPLREYGILTRRDDIRTLAVEWFLQTIEEMHSAD